MPLEDASAVRAEKPHVVLIPWDPESPEHCQRLRLQRVACGWKMEKIQAWRKYQREGKMSIHWAVSDSYFCHVMFVRWNSGKRGGRCAVCQRSVGVGCREVFDFFCLWEREGMVGWGRREYPWFSFGVGEL